MILVSFNPNFPLSSILLTDSGTGRGRHNNINAWKWHSKQLMGPDFPPAPPPEAPRTEISAAAIQAPPIITERQGFRYVVLGNSLLNPKTVQKCLAKGAEPKTAFEALNQCYQDRGYFLVGLRGNLEGNTLTIQVTEGRITEMAVAENLEGYFSGLQGRPGLTRNTVIRKAILAEAYAARQGQRPQLKFEPAAEVGGSRLTATEEPLEGARPWSANVGFGNYGNRYSSRWLARIDAALRPGQGFEFNASYAHGFPNLSEETEDSRYDSGSVGLSAVTPWGVYDARYAKTAYRLGGIFSSGDFEGDFSSWSLNGAQLLYASDASRWLLTQAYTDIDDVFTDDLFFPDRINTGQWYRFLTLGTAFSTSFQTFGNNASLNAKLGVAKEVGGTYETEIAPGWTLETLVDPAWILYEGSLAFSQSLPKGFEANVSAVGQWTHNVMPQQKQWVLGGYGNLSAWFPGVVVGDRGVTASAGLALPAWSWGPLTLRPNLFVEGGYSDSNLDPGLKNQYLSDAGLSLTASLTSGTSVTLVSALPLATRVADLFDPDENRADVYFLLNQKF